MKKVNTPTHDELIKKINFVLSSKKSTLTKEDRQNLEKAIEDLKHLKNLDLQKTNEEHQKLILSTVLHLLKFFGPEIVHKLSDFF